MVDPGETPALAVALAAATYPETTSLTWDGITGGDLSRTWRLTAMAHRQKSTAIVKWTPAHTDDNGHGSREAHAYHEVLDRIETPTPRLISSVSDEKASCLILEDLSATFRFPGNEHRWTPDELELVVRAYARLHIDGASIERRTWMLGYQSPDWTPRTVKDDITHLQHAGAWGPLPGVEVVAEEALEELHLLDGMSSLLHLDCDPSNAGLMLTPPRHVALIDWDMAGWGAPELDLSYLHLHPFAAAASIERARLLEIYWNERRSHGDSIPDKGQRRLRQRTADRILAFALIRVARRSLDKKHLPGRRAERYWSVMRPRLFRRVAELVKP